jgi:hypothetical protein
MIQNKDYELVPAGEDQWHIRILTGDFTETIFQFGYISIDEDFEGDDGEGLMRYNFDIISTPDPTIATDNIDDNEPLQETVANILLSLMEEAVSAKSEKVIDDKHRTDGTS